MITWVADPWESWLLGREATKEYLWRDPGEEDLNLLSKAGTDLPAM